MDGMKPDDTDPAAFIADMCAFVNSRWAERGVAGCDLVAAEWDAQRRTIFLETISGAEALNVRRVSAFLKAEQARVAQRLADGMGKLL